MTIIDCQHLQVSLSEQPILTDVSFQLQQGDYLCLVGPNGSGKSTLLKCLNGLIKPSAGQLTIANQSIHHYRQKQLAQQISYVPQGLGHDLPFTVDDFVRMARYPHQSFLKDWSTIDEKAVQIAFEISHCQQFKSRLMNTLSGGECQRVMIAAAIAQDTPIMLLDEPTSHLDPHHQVAVHQLIQTLNQQHGKTIVEVTHDINHASLHAQSVLAMHQGQSVWHGAAKDFLTVERLQMLYQQAFILLPHPQTNRRYALVDVS